jgi:hypothetical protein
LWRYRRRRLTLADRDVHLRRLQFCRGDRLHDVLQHFLGHRGWLAPRLPAGSLFLLFYERGTGYSALTFFLAGDSGDKTPHPPHRFWVSRCAVPARAPDTFRLRASVSQGRRLVDTIAYHDSRASRPHPTNPAAARSLSGSRRSLIAEVSRARVHPATPCRGRSAIALQLWPDITRLALPAFTKNVNTRHTTCADTHFSFSPTGHRMARTFTNSTHCRR